MTNLNQGWGRKLKLASVPVILAGLAACATPFKADVSRFQTQLPAPQGETYFVVADDPALAGGLEFAQYADLVEAQMSSLGYAQAASPEDASLLVRFDYEVDKGRERVRSTGFSDPFYSRGTATVRGPVITAPAMSAAAGAMAITTRGSAGRKSAATPSTPARST